MKYGFVIFGLFSFFILTSHVAAQDTTTKRRPDQTEFVTETQVRLTTESLTVAEVSLATQSVQPDPGFWEFVVQSWQDFLSAIKSLFNWHWRWYMSKRLLSALFILALLIAPSTLAESPRESRESRREEIQENRAERAETRQEARSQVAENHASRLERRFNHYYKRLTNILERFQKRLDYLNSQDKEVGSIQAKLDTIKAKLAGAKTAGDEAIAAFKAIEPGSWEEQKSALQTARDLANKARDLYKEVHTLLKSALKDLKLISKPALPANSAAVEQSL